jgi:DNA-binding NarL/FixJ family response regulator
MCIKVLLADDHKLLRQGLYSMLEKEKDIKVVAQAQNGREAVLLSNSLNPDVVILDINMPDLNGIDAAKQISSGDNNVRIIALSIHSTKRFVTGMLNAGAMGYLVKQCAYEELAIAIRAVADNKSYLSPQIHNVVVSEYASSSSKDEDSILSMLSQREREVLQLIVEGVKSADIAARLFVSVKTISSHRGQVMKKLNINSVAQLTRLCISEGLISADL